MSTTTDQNYDPKTAKAKIVDVTQGTPRTELTGDQFRLGSDFIASELQLQVLNKGSHGAASTHEVLGVLEEEMYELKMAIHQNDRKAFLKELTQIAVACIWGIASEVGKTLDW